MCPFYFNIPRTSTFCFSTTFLTYLLCNFIRGQNALRIVLREGVKKLIVIVADMFVTS